MDTRENLSELKEATNHLDQIVGNFARIKSERDDLVIKALVSIAKEDTQNLYNTIRRIRTVLQNRL